MYQFFSMKRTIIFLFSTVLVLGSLTSCATLFAKKQKSMSTSSEPSEARVYVNGHKMGKTPVDLKLKPKKDYMVEFKKDGYETITRNIETKTGAGWIVLDILGGVIPVAIDAATNNWQKFSEDSFKVDLDKTESEE